MKRGWIKDKVLFEKKIGLFFFCIGVSIISLTLRVLLQKKTTITFCFTAREGMFCNFRRIYIPISNCQRTFPYRSFPLPIHNPDGLYYPPHKFLISFPTGRRLRGRTNVHLYNHLPTYIPFIQIQGAECLHVTPNLTSSRTTMG